jgi:hypothetical protein
MEQVSLRKLDILLIYMFSVISISMACWLFRCETSILQDAQKLLKIPRRIMLDEMLKQLGFPEA